MVKKKKQEAERAEDEEFELNLEKLEEEIKEAKLDLRNLEFDQFVQQPSIDTEGSEPSLERVAGGQERPIFVGGIPQGPAAAEGGGEKDEFKYVASTEATNEPKYVVSESRITVEPTRVRFAQVGRDQPLRQTPAQVNQEQFFERFSEQPNLQSQMVEKRRGVERFDTSQAGREDPLKVDEKKYEKYEPETSSLR